MQFSVPGTNQGCRVVPITTTISERSYKDDGPGQQKHDKNMNTQTNAKKHITIDKITTESIATFDSQIT